MRKTLLLSAFLLSGCYTTQMATEAPITAGNVHMVNNYELCTNTAVYSYSHPFLVTEVKKRKIDCQQIITTLTPVISAEIQRQQAETQAISAALQQINKQPPLLLPTPPPFSFQKPTNTNCRMIADTMSCTTY